MRKADLVARIAEKNEIGKFDVIVVMEDFFKEVKETLSGGENVYIRGFGSFVAKKRARKVGRNIHKEESIVIPEHFVPAFKPAKVFVDQVRQNLTPKSTEAAPAAEEKPKKTRTKKA